MTVSGHLWTIAPTLRQVVAPLGAPESRPWSTTLEEPEWGTVNLTGALDEVAGSDTLVLVVHGLGGSHDSPYCWPAAAFARARGWSSLRISLRGADCQGDDFYHAGLVADLEAALADAALPRVRNVFVLGYSLGGHVTLRFAASTSDPRIRAVATICAPLDLGAGAAAFDAPRSWVYRRHVLKSLNAIYGAVARRRSVPTPFGIVQRLDSIRSWDAMTVAPRHGFFSVGDYYDSMSAAGVLHRLSRPTLMVMSKHDPMVPPATLNEALRRVSPSVDVRWIDSGGHVTFPRRIDIGEAGERGLEAQVMSWFAKQIATAG